MDINALYKSLPEPDFSPNWMTQDPSCAMLISLGAGPWKLARRTAVQLKAVDWFLSHHYKDLQDIEIPFVIDGDKPAADVYPLKWQNDYLYHLVINLQLKGIRFKFLTNIWRKGKDWQDNLKQLFYFVHPDGLGSKVLWMFARDYLQIPAFPIDRHVKRFLIEHKLPRDPWKMTQLCLDCGIDPNDFNRRIFSNSRGDNPNVFINEKRN